MAMTSLFAVVIWAECFRRDVALVMVQVDAKFIRAPAVDNLNMCMEGHLAPEFYLLGAQKCGTTALSDRLRWHRAMIFPEKVSGDPGANTKEMHIFDNDERLQKGKTFWLSHYPECQQENRNIAVDATPNYFCKEAVPKRIASFYPQSFKTRLTFMVLLRDPLRRMYSAWWHYKITGVGGDEATKGGFAEYARNLVSKADEGKMKEQIEGDNCAPFHGSFYDSQFESYFRIFNPRQFIIAPSYYEATLAPGKPDVSRPIYDALRIAEVPCKKCATEAIRANTHDYPSMENLLDADLFSKLRALVYRNTNATTVAEVLAAHPGAVLFGYQGGTRDVTGIAGWLKFFWDKEN